MKNLAENMAHPGRLLALMAPVALMALVALMAVFAGTVRADENPGPQELVEQTTDRLLAIVREHRGDTESEAFYSKVTEVLDPVVDFAFIARVVMGDHADKASAEQMAAFKSTFKDSLVKTYSRGIEGYVDSRVRVLPLSEELGDRRRVSINQEVRDGSSVYRLSYTMARNRAGEWKLINVVLDGVNLGQSFRSQFAQAMRQHDDLDKVIANWLADA